MELIGLQAAPQSPPQGGCGGPTATEPGSDPWHCARFLPLATGLKLAGMSYGALKWTLGTGPFAGDGDRIKHRYVAPSG